MINKTASFGNSLNLFEIAMRLSLIIIAALLACSSAGAAIDLITPGNGNHTNQSSVKFEYYVNNMNATNCHLSIDNVTSAANSTIAEGFNSFTTSLATGMHQWKVICTNSTTTSESSSRNVTLDQSAPTIVLFTPLNNQTIKSQNTSIGFVTLDNYASEISCEIKLNNQTHYTTIAQNSQAMSINLNSLQQGTYLWNIQCTDLALNSVISETRMFTINTTAETPQFSFSLSRATFITGETGEGVVTAPPNSSVRVEVCPDTNGFVECIVPLNAQNSTSFPLYFTLPFTKHEGKYIIEAYFISGQTSQEKVERYNVTSNLQISIDYTSRPRKNDPILFEAQVIGGIQPYNYTWQLSNGNKYYNKKTNITYSSPGNYNTTLIVKDAYNNTRNQSISFEVSASNQVIFAITDESTGMAVKDATIEIDGQEKETNSDGLSTFYIRSGMRDITIMVQNYSILSQELNISKDETISLKLKRLVTTVKKPEITLTYPEDKQVIFGTTTEVGFKVAHNKDTNCSIYIAEDISGFYTYLGSAQIPASDTGERRFEIIELENKTYYWKVECADNQDQVADSSVREMKVGLGNLAIASSAPSTISALDSKAGELNDILSQIDSMPPDLKEAVSAIGFGLQLQANARLIKNSIRDIDSLNYNNIGLEEKATKIKSLTEKADKAYLSSPAYFELIASDSFVQYIEKAQLEELAKEIMSIEHPNKTFNMKRSLKNLEELQQEIVVSTKTRSLSVNFKDGTTKEYTVIIRDIKAYNITSEVSIVEQIPKSLAKSANEIKSAMSFKIIKDDPIISFPIKKDTEISYYFEDIIDLEDMRDILTAAYSNQSDLESQATGFSIFEFDMGGSNNSLMFMLGLVIIGGLVVGAWKYEGHKVAKYAIYLVSKGETTHYINVVINDISDNLSMGNVEKAIQLYEEAKQAYSDLPNAAKNEVFESIVSMAKQIQDYQIKAVSSSDASKILERVEQTEDILNQSQLALAIQAYKEIEETYHSLDENSKGLVNAQISELGRKIQIIAASDKEWR